MRTDSELRAAFDRLAATAPTPTLNLDALPPQQLSPSQRPPRRRRTVLVLATAAATATAAIGLRVGLEQAPVAGQPGEAWQNWITVTAPAGMIVNPRAYQANRQIYQLAGVDSPWQKWCLLTLHRNGDFNPSRIPANSPRVDINGLAGRLATMPDGEPVVPFPPGYAMSFGKDGRPVTSVAWQPAKGIWALLACQSQRHWGTVKVPTIDAPSDSDPTTALAIAKTVKATPQRLTSPFKLGYVPAGLHPLRVQDKTSNFPGDGHSFSMIFTDNNPATGTVDRPLWSGDKDHPKAGEGVTYGSIWGPQAQPGEDLEITYSTDKFWNAQTRIGTSPDLTIHGYKAWYLWDHLETIPNQNGAPAYQPGPKNVLRLERNGVAITIRTLDTPVNTSALRRIAESLTLPNKPLDPHQWYDASTALPH
ncbi:hypothetical protein AB0E69_35070 [Kribbella sp. NPDC026611]|uniref:hypothetical protein n=1 Tax=Kribbella sp. NPDC026611 TaxID=3154911 RepID=UPI0033FAEE76